MSSTGSIVLHRQRLIIRGERYLGRAYIAGESDGIVTVGGKPAIRQIFALEHPSMAVVQKTWSFADGTYLLPNLDPTKKYVVLAIDHLEEFEPVAYSHVSPFAVQQ